MVLGVFISVPVTVNAEDTILSGKFGRNLNYEYNIETMTLTLSGSGNTYSDFSFPAEVKVAKEVTFDNYTSTSLPKLQGFENLKELIIPEGVTTFEYYNAFSGCISLEKVTIPEGVTHIPYGAFEYCSSLKEVNLPSSINDIDWFAFRKCTSLTDFVVPEGVEELVEDVFRDCTSLKNVTLPSTLRKISCYVFYGCTALEEIMIPEGVTEITYKNFQYCENLKKIVIPESTTVIDSDNFDYSDNVKIYGCSESYAEKFANENGIEFISIHKHNYTSEITKPGTCISDGIKTFSCSCGHSYTEKFDATDEHTNIVWYLDYDATCTKEGRKYKVCNDCLTLLGETTIPKKEHSPSSWFTDKNATVNAAGKKHKECTKCGEVLETAKIPQLKCSKPKLSKIENTADGVKITWGKVSGADKYDVYRKTGSSGKYSKIGTTSKTYYTDKKASSGKKYYYYVKAVNEAGSSEASSSLSKYYLADTTLSTPKSTKSGITLKWKKVTGADGYMVYRKTGSGSYSKIATVKGNSKITYTDKKAKKGKTYTYKIKAYKSKTYSAYSNAKKIKDKY